MEIEFGSYDHTEGREKPAQSLVLNEQRWYVINGELMDKEGEPLGIEVVRVDTAQNYEEMIDLLRRDFPGVTCINSDYFSEFSAKSYKVQFNYREVTILRPVDGLHEVA